MKELYLLLILSVFTIRGCPSLTIGNFQKILVKNSILAQQTFPTVIRNVLPEYKGLDMCSHMFTKCKSTIFSNWIGFFLDDNYACNILTKLPLIDDSQPFKWGVPVYLDIEQMDKYRLSNPVAKLEFLNVETPNSGVLYYELVLISPDAYIGAPIESPHFTTTPVTNLDGYREGEFGFATIVNGEAHFCFFPSQMCYHKPLGSHADQFRALPISGPALTADCATTYIKNGEVWFTGAKTGLVKFKNGQFTVSSILKVERSGHAGIMHEKSGQFYLVGGQYENGDFPLTTAILDISTSNVSFIEDTLTIGMTDIGGGVWTNSENEELLIIFGGTWANGTFNNDTYVFDASVQEWTIEPSLSYINLIDSNFGLFHPTVQMLSGSIYVVATYNANSYILMALEKFATKWARLQIISKIPGNSTKPLLVYPKQN